MNTIGRSSLLDDVVFEIIPMRNAFEKAADLPAGASVSVTASPTRGMESTIDLSVRLAEHGYRVIPHLSARLTKSRSELESHVTRLAAAGVKHAFVVGGDDPEPGEFFDAMALIRSLETIDHPFIRIGVAGYPEGHPFISEERLVDALRDKQPYASHITTQMCFDAGHIATWLDARRGAGIELPVVVGVPGVIDTMKLMAIGARIGVGASLKYLSKNRRSVARLLRPGTFTPDDLIHDLAEIAADPTRGVIGVHLFTFNQVEPTLEWLQRMRG